MPSHLLPTFLTAVFVATQGFRDSARTASALEELSVADRKLVEDNAKYFERFPDGSMWTRRVEAERDARKKDSPVLVAYSDLVAPLWYCPATDARATNKDGVFQLIDEADIRAQLAGGEHFQGVKTLFVTSRGILADCGTDLILLDAPKKEIVKEEETLKPFWAVPEEVDFFVVPSRSPAFRELPSGTGAAYQPLPPGRHFVWGQTMQVMRWKVVEPPKSRIVPQTKAVTPEELAESIRKKEQPGIVIWTPTLEHHGDQLEGHWVWKPKLTKLTFKSIPKSDQKSANDK